MNLFVGLSISTDRQLPCEAAHRITFSLAQPEGVQPLTLCFPYPFLVHCVDVTLRRSDRSIQVVLKKALNEPWPCHFAENPKWKVDNFKLWEKEKTEMDRFALLLVHVLAQGKMKNAEKFFESISVTYLPEYRLLPPLEIARSVIKTIFGNIVKGCEYFVVFNTHPPPSSCSEFLENARKLEKDEPLFTICAHPPVLVTPFGSPMLLISVLDHCLSKKLVENGHLKSKQAEEDFKRIFLQKKEKNPVILLSTDSSINFLRYMLRLNATKIVPSSWQENNLPLGKYSPYLATYISPLYSENLSTCEPPK